VRSVQRLVTTFAVLLVLVCLTFPGRLEELHPTTLARLPLEPLVFLALVLALPARLGRLRDVLAVVAGVLLGTVAVFRLLDLGFEVALDRPFDVLIDWYYAGSLASLVRDSFGDGTGTVLLVLAGLVVVALLVLLPLSVLRLSRVAARHRRRSVVVVAGLGLVWASLAVVGVDGRAGPLAARDTAGYVVGQVTRVPGALRDRREFAEAARTDPLREAPTGTLLAGLRGKDVLVVFVESYGRVALTDAAVAPGVRHVLDEGTARLRAAGFRSRSAFLTSPTFGGISWLAHATLQSGLWVDSQPRYDVLATSPRLTLSRLFGLAGWRTVAAVPANDRAWPQGGLYGFDRVYDSRSLGYTGPRFGYAKVPDQYTLDALRRRELAPRPRRPVMAEIDLVSSHTPWTPTPRLVAPSALGDGSVFDPMIARLSSADDVWPAPDRVRAAYGGAIEYSLSSLVRFVATSGDDDLVVVLLGDHQPARIVSGPDADHDVPVAILARDPGVLSRIAPWGWVPGLRPSPDAPVWRMDAFRDRFVAAYRGGARP
jgi:hypothetical protein